MPLPDPIRQPAFYAGVAPKRALAWVADVAATLLLCLLALPLTAFTAILWWPILWVAVGTLYRWASLSALSATLGMALMGITLRDRDGRPLAPQTALLHTLGYAVSVALFLPQLLSVALMGGLGRGQGLTDLGLGTAAINRPARRLA